MKCRHTNAFRITSAHGVTALGVSKEALLWTPAGAAPLHSWCPTCGAVLSAGGVLARPTREKTP